jgi:hypothetical protein
MKRVNVLQSLVLPNLLIGIAVALAVIGFARHALASDASCERTVTRTWNSGTGGWVYSDSGCVQVDCSPSNPCKEFTDGQGGRTCGCTDAPNITRPCVKRVVYDQSGTPVGAGCINGTCSNPCDPVWTPIHGDPQTLTCPCP